MKWLREKPMADTATRLITLIMLLQPRPNQTAAQLAQTFTPPVDFNLQAYLASDPFFQPAVQVRLRFGPEVAVVAQDNRAFWRSIEEHRDGAIIVTFEAADLEAAAGMVLRVGFPAAILEPVGLLELVRQQARALSAHFDALDERNKGAVR
jgi:predicted DNA-binding transcriptional regulator YafY